MAAIFFVCAGFPLAALAALTIVRTTSEIATAGRERLRFEARTLGEDAANRLGRLAEGLQSLTRALELDDSATLGRGIKLSDHLPMLPRGAVIRLTDGTIIHLAGSLELPEVSRADELHLESRGRLLASNGQTPLMLVRGMRRGAVAAVTIDERWVFGLDEPDHLPPDTAACVATGLGRIECSIDVARDVIADAFETVRDRDVTIATPSGPQSAWLADIELGAAYRARPWRYALMRSRAAIRAPLRSFVQDLLLVVTLTALVVGWVSMRQVRRQLRPLVALTEATTRLRHGEFAGAIEVQSDDEFAAVGEAFNDMALELRKRFDDLEAFNIGTLRTLARAIDAKSHWTAGHSERVTAVAVALARALDLPEAEVRQLERGGLVHDIGKIATPAEILDKPTLLSAEEMRIVQLHPEQGVHILDPLPAFREVLPIVGQHHERWDGSGYPARLAGTAIARTARVLAVADVYDALRSDRPYRSGLPHARVVTVIRNASGRHFDPDVVAAFLQIEQDIEGLVPGRSADSTVASA